jgi:hypothetical protein
MGLTQYGPPRMWVKVAPQLDGTWCTTKDLWHTSSFGLTVVPRLFRFSGLLAPESGAAQVVLAWLRATGQYPEEVLDRLFEEMGGSGESLASLTDLPKLEDRLKKDGVRTAIYQFPPRGVE